MRASYAPKSRKNPASSGGIPVIAIVAGAAVVGVAAYLILRSRNARASSPQFHPAVVGSGLQGIGFFSGGGGGGGGRSTQTDSTTFTPPPPSTSEPTNIYGGSSPIRTSDLAPVSSADTSLNDPSLGALTPDQIAAQQAASNRVTAQQLIAISIANGG